MPRFIALLAVPVLGTLSLPAAPQFPGDKPVKIVVAFAPGTGSDVMARLVADDMGPLLP